ncbi:precorrin-3B synthase [Streptomyces chilikensis]|uniref:precorrin-3B synthase n=1 Tax=Streptomyces chilikensis TaxID=1194079 RepID=UPI0019D2AE9C|nr:precorrin-3B synthase [Streptomyces chilikensis]
MSRMDNAIVSARRARRDRCPGVLRPWPAEDGLLIRLRLIGGRLPTSSLTALTAVAERHGDGRVHVTGRANLQIRALPGHQGRLGSAVLDAVEATGLLPSRTHELVRNVMVSPRTGTAGGRADLRPVAAELDRLLCADPYLAGLPARFLFVLDDGRGDLVTRPADLGLVALDQDTAQLRIGDSWGPVVPLPEAAPALTGLARSFMDARGTGPTAPWHVVELPAPMAPPGSPDPRLPSPEPPLPPGPLPEGGRHVGVPDDGMTPGLTARLVDDAHAAGATELTVTPWRGVIVPGAAA